MKHDPLQIARSRELRKKPTTAEAILWRELRSWRFGAIKFRRQQPFGPYILDFYCAQLGLVIELDGESHLGKETTDRRRQAWLETRGLRIVRILNVELYENRDGVMEQIDRECQARIVARANAIGEGEVLRESDEGGAAPSP